MNEKKILALSLFVFIIVFIGVTLLVTEMLSSIIYFTFFIGFPAGLLVAVLSFFTCRYLLKKYR